MSKTLGPIHHAKSTAFLKTKHLLFLPGATGPGPSGPSPSPRLPRGLVRRRFNKSSATYNFPVPEEHDETVETGGDGPGDPFLEGGKGWARNGWKQRIGLLPQSQPD